MSPTTPWMPQWRAAASTLRETLLDKGIFTASEARQAAAMVTSARK